MLAVVGPILLKEGCYAFDLWTPEEGLCRGYAYRRIEDANYARNAEIRSRGRSRSGAASHEQTIRSTSQADNTRS